jgi:uncharacterized membrane protein YdjX (TVP38/TMEM64 family)
MMDYSILFAVVLGVNLMPAFGPPTWSIIVLYGLSTKLPVPAVVITGALAAALGRFLLAHAFRALGSHAPDRMKRNAAAAGRALERKKRNTILALGLFALSPLPSAQLFEAAGLVRVRLLGFTAAFFAGRLVSYSAYAMTAKSIQRTTLGAAFRHSLTSPWGIGLQLATVALVVALMQVDLEKRLRPVEGFAGDEQRRQPLRLCRAFARPVRRGKAGLVCRADIARSRFTVRSA